MLFLFFGGVVIFLFNVDQGVFICVVSWIGLFSIAYGLVTLMPSMRHYSPYSAPLSIPTWFLCTSIQFVTFKILAFITDCYGCYQTLDRSNYLRDRYRRWMFGGVERAAEEMTEEQSSKIDVHILGWTIRALGDDDLLEKFFEAIPGFFNSRLVKRQNRFPRDTSPNDLGCVGWVHRPHFVVQFNHGISQISSGHYLLGNHEPDTLSEELHARQSPLPF